MSRICNFLMHTENIRTRVLSCGNLHSNFGILVSTIRLCVQRQFAKQDEQGGDVPDKDQLQLGTMVPLPRGNVLDVLYHRPSSQFSE